MGAAVATQRQRILHISTPWIYASVEAWKAYLAAQAAAGTPVTIVYELAAPETEALTAISPIAPAAGAAQPLLPTRTR